MYKLKRDKYKSKRGGYSRLINVYCRKCNNLIAVYQKDGPGNLRRMYFDRIFSPSGLINLQYEDIKKVKHLVCTKCGELIGIPYIYEKESRKAFKLFQASVIKKQIKTEKEQPSEQY